MMNQNLAEAEVLQENYLVPNSPYDGKFNKTSQFMTPAIGIDVTHKLVFKYFENAFLADREHKHSYTRPIFMLFSIKNFQELDWKKVYGVLITSKNYITEYDVGIKDGKFLFMMVFKVPDEYAEDYNHFRMGRYSLFSKSYKEKFPEFLDKEKKKKNMHWRIINKDPKLMREIARSFMVSEYQSTLDALQEADEIWDIPRREREFYRYKQKK